MSAVAFPTARQPSCDGDGKMLISTSLESSINYSRLSPNFATSGPQDTTPATDVHIVSHEPFAVEDPRRPPQSQQTITLSWTMEPLPDAKQPISSSSSSKKSSLLHSVKLPKKPSLFTPSFLQQPPSLTDSPPPLPTRARSFSAVQLSTTPNDLLDPPLLDIPAPSLLDDDPFANLTSSHIPHFTESPTSFEHHILSEVPRPFTVVVSPQVYVPPPTVARPRSSGHGQVRSASTRPAFATRPSLPSLYSLAQMNATIPRKVRKGTPGARLPHEPWNMDLSAQFNLPTRNIPTAGPSRSLDNPTSSSRASPPETTAEAEDNTARATSVPELHFSSREVELASPAVVDESCSSRSLSGDDADVDSLPSLSYTTSEPSSSALSRSSSMVSSPWLEGTMDQNNSRDNNAHKDKHDGASITPHAGDEIPEDDDPLSYHSDFDYYTQSLSDLSDFEPDVEPASDRTTKSSHAVVVTPQCHPPGADVDFEPETSAETMHNTLRERLPIVGRFAGSPTVESPQEGGEWRGHRCGPEKQNGEGDGRRGREVGRSNGGYSGGQSSGGYGGGAGGDDNKGDKPRQRKSPSSVSSASDSTSDSDDDADRGTVYYSLDGMSNGPPSRAQSRTQSRHSKAGGGSDDDVPLAQRVPTALSAQRSIRRQLRDEREQKKLERAKSLRVAAAPPPLPLPLESARAPAPPPTSYRKRSASAAPAPVTRSRAPSIEPFPGEDLTGKLMNLQTSSHTPTASVPLAYHTPTSSRAAAYGGGISRSSSRGKHMDPAVYGQQKTTRTPDAPSQDRPLRSMRSFHRPDGRYSESQRAVVEQPTAPQLGRSTTIAGSSRAARTGGDIVSPGYEQYAKLGRTIEETRRPSASAPRPSMDRAGDAVQRVVQRPPVPPLPIPDPMPPQHHIPRGPVVQQRIFIRDMQRFNIVEITPATSAKDVIDIVASQGVIDRSGPWMLFELAQDYGMERPIRDYELLAEVSASWNKDKLLNAFVIKQTPLAPSLSPSAIPSSSPTHRGWVEWESKRGKWSKRWMELREHGLWLSKRDTGKDEVFLCSLSNFDAYLMTRRHKAPKAFVFGIKSTDHLSLFENAADYLHVFTCNPKDGEKWMQVILVARSYVLYQERNVLFAKAGEPLSQPKPLVRSRTRKQSVSARPAQPLVNVPPPFGQSPAASIAFEPGSLLAKRKDDIQP